MQAVSAGWSSKDLQAWLWETVNHAQLLGHYGNKKVSSSYAVFWATYIFAFEIFPLRCGGAYDPGDIPKRRQARRLLAMTERLRHVPLERVGSFFDDEHAHSSCDQKFLHPEKGHDGQRAHDFN